MAKDYTQTLNLPKSELRMRGRLPQREPAFLENRKKIDLYNTLNE